MISNIKISIIVPIYMVEKELPRCIDSLINQTYQNIEIILVNDGSTDRCPIICEEYAERDKRICVVHKKNGGLSDARNAGIDIAKGDYFLLVDSDDYIDLNTCRNFIDAIGDDEPDIVVGNYVLLSEHTEIPYKHIKIVPEVIYNSETYILEALSGNEMNMEAWLNLYRTSFWRHHHFSFKKGILHEDMQLIPRVLLRAESIKHMQHQFYYYIVREGSIMNQSNREKRYKDMMDIYKEWNEIAYEINSEKLRYSFSCFLSKCFVHSCGELNVTKPNYKIVSRRHLLRYSKGIKEITKAILFILAPRLYCVAFKWLNILYDKRKSRE